MQAKRHAVRGGHLCSLEMPPKKLSQAALAAFFASPFPGPGGAFKPLKYLSEEDLNKIAESKNRNRRHNSAAAVLQHSPKSPAPSPPSVADVADKILENQRMYRESESFDSPVAANVR